jgi:hypothetical protein
MYGVLGSGRWARPQVRIRVASELSQFGPPPSTADLGAPPMAEALQQL